MLARFMMNETYPISVRFIQKPVYSAFGMLAGLSTKATKFFKHKTINYVLSVNEQYAAVLLLSSDENYLNVRISIGAQWNHTKFAYIAEFIDQEYTNPYNVWLKYNKPAFPNETVWNKMHHAQVNIKFEFNYFIYYTNSSKFRVHIFLKNRKRPQSQLN